MLIRVLCKDKGRGFVEDFHLDDLIERGIVVAFFRPSTNEWIDIQEMPIRKQVVQGYHGPERRVRRQNSGESPVGRIRDNL